MQSVVEKYLKNAVEKWNVQQRGMAIVMDVNSGAILAMAVEGGFDPNEPNDCADSTLQSILDTEGALSEEQKGLLYRRLGVTSAEMAKEDYSLNQILADGVIDDETSTARCRGMIRYAQWKNKCLTALYYPGSVFKIITSAMGLDSGAATTATSFGCYGSLTYPAPNTAVPAMLPMVCRIWLPLCATAATFIMCSWARRSARKPSRLFQSLWLYRAHRH